MVEGERSAWLTAVLGDLAEGLGTQQQKLEVAEVAVQIDAMPDGDFKRHLAPSFGAYVHNFWYLRPGHSPLDDLPETVMEPHADDHKMEGGMTRYERREQSRETRVKRCRLHLDAHWGMSDALAFVCSKEEYQDAVARSFGKGEL